MSINNTALPRLVTNVFVVVRSAQLGTVPYFDLPVQTVLVAGNDAFLAVFDLFRLLQRQDSVCGEILASACQGGDCIFLFLASEQG